MGKHGSEQHEMILRRLRLALPPAMVQRGYPDFMFLLDENLIMGLLAQNRDNQSGKGRLPGSKIPDGLAVGPGAAVLLEVGQYNPDKWPGRAVLHIGFRCDITLIGAESAGFAGDLLAACRQALARLDDG